MSIGDLLPAALAAWVLRRETLLAAASSAVPPSRAVQSSGWVDVASETQAVLEAAKDLARDRGIELQMAVEPLLIARVHAPEYRACVRHLVLGAIGRAIGGVLVTAMRQGDGVEVAVLDDGTLPPGGQHADAAPSAGETLVPKGGSQGTDYQPERGTTVLLHLPLPD